jgi:hypothetical protein
MLSNFFLLPGRTYLNNAIVIADILHVTSYAYGDVKDFNIKFKKPFNSQAELKFSKDPMEGYTVGSFNTKENKIYFSYVPVDIALASKTINSNDINYFNLSYEITDAGRGIVQESFEKEFGPMSSTDKVIFAVCDIPDTSIINNVIKYQRKPKINISKAEHIGNRRFKYSVLLDDKFFSYRYCSVKEFNI